MSRTLSAMIGALALGLCVAGAGAASAHGYRHGCAACGPVGTSRYYKTIHPSSFVTRYHDRAVFNHVTKIHHVVNVTRVQPIIHVHDITRVHHHTIVSVRDAYSYQTQHLTPITYVQHSTVNTYDCSCGH